MVNFNRNVFKKLSVVRERIERLVAMQYPYREVSYKKLENDLITKFDLTDPKTILKYLGRPETVKPKRVSQEVRYLRSGAVVPKEHVFRVRLERKMGLIEKWGYAKMFLKDGVPYFRLFYENLINKPLLLFQECEGVEDGEISLSPYNTVKDVEDSYDSAGNLEDSKTYNMKEKKEECLIGEERNLVYKCKHSENKKEQDYPEFQIFYAEPLKNEPDKAKVSWKGDSDG